MRPNLFIVGAPKCGSASLVNHLAKYDQFFFPKVKELNYFSQETSEASYYDAYIIKSESNYLRLYKKAKNKIYLGDGSVSYFIDEQAASRIKNFNPHSKIVICLRDPIKRAYSHYLMDLRMGHASKPLLYYIQNPTSSPQHYSQYIENSLYLKHIKRFVECFGSDNVHFVFLENFQNDITTLLNGLKIKLSDELKNEPLQRVNQSKSPKYKVSKYLQKNRRVVSKLKFMVPTVVIKNLNPLLYSSSKSQHISDEEYNVLENIFQDEKDKVINYINSLNE